MDYSIEFVQDFDGSCYANMTVEGKDVTGLPEYVTWLELGKAILAKTGIHIPRYEDLTWEKLGRKHYAYASN